MDPLMLCAAEPHAALDHCKICPRTYLAGWRPAARCRGDQRSSTQQLPVVMPLEWRQPAAARRRAAWRAVRDATEFTCVGLQKVSESKAASALLQVEQMASEAWSPLWQVGT